MGEHRKGKALPPARQNAPLNLRTITISSPPPASVPSSRCSPTPTSSPSSAVDSMMTLENPKGLCEVSQKPGGAVLVCLGLHEGQVRVNRYRPERSKFISAHSSGLTCFALTLDGEFLATASRKGTLIRVFNTSDGTLLREARRGAEKAEIHSLALSSNLQWLAASSGRCFQFEG